MYKFRAKKVRSRIVNAQPADGDGTLTIYTSRSLRDVDFLLIGSNDAEETGGFKQQNLGIITTPQDMRS